MADYIAVGRLLYRMSGSLRKLREVQMSSALDEFKKPIEDWAGALVNGKPMENLLILYKLLYALGCRIDGIDVVIDRLCVAAIKKAKTSL